MRRLPKLKMSETEVDKDGQGCRRSQAFLWQVAPGVLVGPQFY
jgi:hypothetical protein